VIGYSTKVRFAEILADEPAAKLNTQRAYQGVGTFARLIHKQNRAGIMVTHNLRIGKDVDQVISMLDGKIARIIDNKAEILAMAALGEAELAAT
jgi:putative ABC transport system ATP-binding protein